MDSVPPRKKENEDHSMFLSSVASTETFLTSRGLCTPLELPKEANSVGFAEVSPGARGLLKQNNLETTFPECQTKRAVHPKGENESTLHRTSEKNTESFCKRNRVRKSSLGQHGSKASQCILLASLKNKTLAKAMKLGPITYRDALKVTGKLCKAQLPLLKNHLGDGSDLFNDGEALLHEIATAHPKYNQIIRTLPILLNFIPGELKEKLMIEENAEWLKMGAYLVNKWISRSQA